MVHGWSDRAHVRYGVRGGADLVARGWLRRAVWETVPAPVFAEFRDTARFRARVLDLPHAQVRAVLMSPDMVRRRGKRYAYTTGPVTVIGIWDGAVMTLIEVVVRDAATVAARSDDD